MSTFFTDLDNTIVYSHRRNLSTEKTVVEYLEGQKQSYITNRTYDYLRNSLWLDIVPVTTRTFSQFSRLFLQELRIRHALICNGGMHLIDGIEEEEWTKDTLESAGSQIGEIERVFDIIREMCPETVIHMPTPYMVYFKTNDLFNCSEELRSRIECPEICFYYDRNKVYLLAANVDKGKAVARFGKKMKKEIDIAAGDSEMDVPMLNLAKYAIASKRIAGLVKNRNLFVLEGEVISDEICDIIQKLHVSGKI